MRHHLFVNDYITIHICKLTWSGITCFTCLKGGIFVRIFFITLVNRVCCRRKEFAPKGQTSFWERFSKQEAHRKSICKMEGKSAKYNHSPWDSYPLVMSHVTPIPSVVTGEVLFTTFVYIFTKPSEVFVILCRFYGGGLRGENHFISGQQYYLWLLSWVIYSQPPFLLPKFLCIFSV